MRVNFATDQEEIECLRLEIKRLQATVYSIYDEHRAAMSRMIDENRRLRDACRSTNRGITRLSKRVQSQARRLAEFRGLLADAAQCLATNGLPPHAGLVNQIATALHGRRPPENAT